MVTDRVIILANDVTPGCGVPVAAPGLRAFGLAEGLRSHGFSVTTVVPKHLLQRVWANTNPPAPLQPGTIALNGRDLAGYLDTAAPATVLLINSNQVAHVRRAPGLRYVLDVFAPKMLELAYQYQDRHPVQELAKLRDSKLQAFELADGIIVNGVKKVPYVVGWMLQTDRDPRAIPMTVVNMPVPPSEHVRRDQPGLRFAIAGYLQGWSLPGEWLDVVTSYVESHGEATLDVVLPTHWGRQGDEVSYPRLTRLVELNNVESHPVMRFSEFQQFLSGVDVVVDLFEPSLEREYAMVTRTVVALSCGVPVIHPPFTEVSSFISQYDAGWLVDCADIRRLSDVVNGIDQAEAARKSDNAVRLWNDVFSPEVATTPLVDLIATIWEDE